MTNNKHKKKYKTAIYLVGSVSTAFVGCSGDEYVSEKPRNYYGTESGDNNTSKEAYYAFAGGVAIIIIFALWLVKKIKK